MPKTHLLKEDIFSDKLIWKSKTACGKVVLGVNAFISRDLVTCTNCKKTKLYTKRRTNG